MRNVRNGWDSPLRDSNGGSTKRTQVVHSLTELVRCDISLMGQHNVIWLRNCKASLDVSFSSVVSMETKCNEMDTPAHAVLRESDLFMRIYGGCRASNTACTQVSKIVSQSLYIISK